MGKQGRCCALLSAERTKPRKRKASETEDDSEDEDVEQAEKRLKTRENRAALEKSARDEQRACDDLLDQIRKAKEQKQHLNDSLRKERNSAPDLDEQDALRSPSTPPMIAKVKVPLDSPNLNLYPSDYQIRKKMMLKLCSRRIIQTIAFVTY